jgi:hypothetical protein
VNTLLSHYTTEAGLLGIAKSKNSWATNFLSLNDTSEYFYAWAAIQTHAVKKVIEKIPPQRNAGLDPDTYAAGVNKKFRAAVAAMDGYGALYVTAFARADKEDHSKRGILTLWDRYTGHKGFCLQFSRAQIEHLVQTEATFFNYGLIEVADVKYGIDENSRDFQDLSYQMQLRMRLELARVTGDASFAPHDRNITRMWADSGLFLRTMRYCACHTRVLRQVTYENTMRLKRIRKALRS